MFIKATRTFESHNKISGATRTFDIAYGRLSSSAISWSISIMNISCFESFEPTGINSPETYQPHFKSCAVHAAECAGSEFLQKLCFVYPADRQSRTSACDNMGNHANQAEQWLEM